MIKYILLGIVAVIVLFLAIASFRPGEFRIERSAVIPAPAAVVYDQINDLQKFQTWSPWAKMEPEAKLTFGSVTAGPGANFSWEGKKTGAGTMTVTDTKPNEHIGVRLDFTRPFKGTNLTDFNFTPEGDQTRVTWTMTGKYNLIMKAMGMFMDCDKMVGDQFDQGLADLKTLAAGR